MSSSLFNRFSHHAVAFSALRTRCYSQLANARSAAVHSSSAPLASDATVSTVKKVKLPYSVPRNSRGSLPVYSDIRNGGTRYLVLVKGVRGNINALRDDIAASLFERGSEEAARMKADILRQDTIVLSGGRWKHRVMDWLSLKGF